MNIDLSSSFSSFIAHTSVEYHFNSLFFISYCQRQQCYYEYILLRATAYSLSSFIFPFAPTALTYGMISFSVSIRLFDEDVFSRLIWNNNNDDGDNNDSNSYTNIIVIIIGIIIIVIITFTIYSNRLITINLAQLMHVIDKDNTKYGFTCMFSVNDK